MNLLPFVFLATIIYLILIAPLLIGVFVVYFVSKQMELEDVTLGNTMKIMSFYMFSGFLFFFIFVIFAANPFANFSVINNNPYLAIVILVSLIATLAFFISVHFKTFFLYVKRFYDMPTVKKIVLYVSTTAAVYFLASFYIPAIQIFLYYSEMAVSR